VRRPELRPTARTASDGPNCVRPPELRPTARTRFEEPRPTARTRFEEPRPTALDSDALLEP